MTPMNDMPTILIVDDTPSNLSVVVTLFEDRGYRVAIAQDGEECLQRTLLLQPDLILLDAMMPGMDGFETCRSLKKHGSTRDIPVIFMTALAMPEHKLKGFRAGAVDYVTKPLQIEEVMARVETHLKLSTAQRKLEEQNAQLEQHRRELEQRVAERTVELAAREREFRTLAENLPDNLARYDRRCRLIYMNSRLERFLGKTLAERAGKTPQESAPGEIFSGYQAGLIATIETGNPGEMELVFPGAGDDARYHHIRFVAERDERGEIVGALAIGRDITERKRAEQQLAMLGAAISQMHEAAYFVDDQARIFYVNDEASRQLGYSRDEFLGMTVMDIAPDWTREMVVNAWQGLGENGAITFEAEHRRKDGGILPVEINVTYMVHDGKAFGLAVVRDITERKRAERELHLRNRALDHAFDATYIIGEDLRLRYVNEAAVRTLGYSREELLAMTLLDIDPNVTREMMREVMRQTAEGGVFRTVESTHRRKDGSVFPIEVGATVFDYEGEILHLTTVRDISERKEAERRLHEKQQAIRAAVENSPDAVVRYDAGLRRIYVNPAMQRAFGLPREDILGKTPEVPGAIMGSDYLQALKQVFSSGREVCAELPFSVPGGETRWVDLRFVPEFGTDGKVSTVLAIGRDITERKRAEEALTVREREFRTLAENIPDHIIRYDRNGRKVYLNMATARLMGVRPDEVLNQTPEETPPDKRAMKIDGFAECLRQVLETGEAQELEVTLRHAEIGEQVHNVRFVAERDEQGGIVGALMVGRDITAMKIIENELAEREQRYREIFDNAVEGMYLLEVTEDGRFRNLDINPALAASTGIPREAMIGRFVDETVPEDIGRTVVEKYRRCVAAGKTIEESMELDLPSGKRHYLSTVTPIRLGGRIHRLIGISRDITELKRAEKELQESRAQLRGLTARREAAREEERKYIAREVHDELGQLLTGLQLNVSVLTHKFAADSQALREQLRETMMLTDKSLAVVRNVASALRPAALDMGIYSALEWLIGRFSTNTGIRCELHAEDMDIQLDETRAVAIFRIVQESLTNVSRHAEACKVDVTFGKQGADYRLGVADDGKGFEVSAKKLDSYGLVGIRERALMLGGVVNIESHPGKGTLIEVRIPIKHQEES